jgi:hypothetical protein
MNKKNINYGKKDVLSKNEFNSENVKVRITTYIDLDILEALKVEAKKTKQKYQTLLNTKLRESVSGEKTIYSSLNSIKERLGKVEHILNVD